MAVKLPISILDWSRSVAGEPDIKLQNRYFESDPSNQENQAALISRPGLKRWITLDTSPVRGLYSQPGSFGSALFAVGGNTAYKIAADETVTTLGTLTTAAGPVSMAATDSYLFVADGATLKCYTENDFARGTLTVTGTISATETVVIGSSHYKFVTDVSPAADGSASAPWLVLMGTTTDTLANLAAAINNDGEAGTDYSLALTANADALASSSDATTLNVRAIEPGTPGNSIATTETMANGAWGAATLAGGGGSSFTTVSVPDGDGIISVAVLAGFTLCLVAQTDPAKNGRFYFIFPGENTIEDLNFETAEKSPDPAYSINILGDQYLIPGADSIEFGTATGNGDAPFERQLGRTFDRGAWPGSICSVGDAIVLVDSAGIPWEVTDAPRPIAPPGVIQRIREAINAGRAA